MHYLGGIFFGKGALFGRLVYPVIKQGSVHKIPTYYYHYCYYQWLLRVLTLIQNFKGPRAKKALFEALEILAHIQSGGLYIRRTSALLGFCASTAGWQGEGGGNPGTLSGWGVRPTLLPSPLSIHTKPTWQSRHLDQNWKTCSKFDYATFWFFFQQESNKKVDESEIS